MVGASSLVLPVDDLVQLAADVEEERVSLSIVPGNHRVIAHPDSLIPRFSFLLDGGQRLKQTIDVNIQAFGLLLVGPQKPTNKNPCYT